MAKKLDVVSDQNPTALYKVAQQMGLPPYVKEQGWPGPEEAARLPVEAFADRAGRRWPLHTKSACFLSAVHFHAQADEEQDSATRNRIKVAAHTFHVEKDIENAIEVLRDTPSPQDMEALHALTIPDPTDLNKKAYVYSLHPEQLSKSARALLQDRDDGYLSTENFHKAAERITAAADRIAGFHRGEIHERVWRAGEKRAADYLSALNNIGPARRMVPNITPEMAACYVDLVKAAAEDDSATPEQLVASIEEIDRQLMVKYSAAILDPWEIVFSGLDETEIEKIAAEVVHVSEVPMPFYRLKELDLVRVDKVFGTEDGNRLVKAAALAASHDDVEGVREALEKLSSFDHSTLFYMLEQPDAEGVQAVLVQE